MKLLFVHNIKLKNDKKGVLYTHGSYNMEVWNRYLSLSKEFSVVCRKDSKLLEETHAKKSFQKFDENIISYIEVPDLTNSISSFISPNKRNEHNKKIEHAVIASDFVIARLPSVSGYQAVKYARKHNKSYLVEVVACSWDGLWNHSLKGKVLAPMSFLKQKRYVKNAQFVIYVTNEFLQNRYPTKGRSTNCSDVALKEFDDSILEKRINKINNKKNDSKLVIGTTAAVDVRYKGQQYIIRAIGKLKEKGVSNIEYQLVGGGDNSYLLSVAKKYNVTDQVRFLGAIPHNKVFSWLDSIDVYAQPSRQEGLPRALVEAMSRGLPAIGAKTAGIPELLPDQYIFSNTQNNINEICTILEGLTQEKMLLQARLNYSTAKKYDKEVIEERRQKFFKEFKDFMVKRRKND